MANHENFLLKVNMLFPYFSFGSGQSGATQFWHIISFFSGSNGFWVYVEAEKKRKGNTIGKGWSHSTKLDFFKHNLAGIGELKATTWLNVDKLGERLSFARATTVRRTRGGVRTHENT